MNRTIPLLIACLLLTACHSGWTLIDNNNRKNHIRELKFFAPAGWVRFNDHHNRYGYDVSSTFWDIAVQRIMFTRDGLKLNLIDVISINLDNAFPAVGKGVTPEILVSELAELFIAEQKLLNGVSSVEVSKNEPARIDSHDAFMIQLSINTPSGLVIQQRSYGFVSNKYFYSITYRAASLYYFDANLMDFKRLVADSRVIIRDE